MGGGWEEVGGVQLPYTRRKIGRMDEHRLLVCSGALLFCAPPLSLRVEGKKTKQLKTLFGDGSGGSKFSFSASFWIPFQAGLIRRNAKCKLGVKFII